MKDHKYENKETHKSIIDNLKSGKGSKKSNFEKLRALRDKNKKKDA